MDESGKEASAQLERNDIPPPPFVSGTVTKGSDTLAFFAADDWKVTVDVAALAVDLPQTGVTPSTQLSTLTAESVGRLVQACYHEARHAEQAFLAARMEAEQAKGSLTASVLSRRVGIKEEIAEVALSAALVTMPDVLKAKAEAWRTFMVGGRHIPYRTWNKEVQDQISVLLAVGLSTMQEYEEK
ncbi:MAG TPA: hypothetical protein VFU98_10480 [Microlunatus sp.]|nr:hypothetical protein [Microlunatus sp.]